MKKTTIKARILRKNETEAEKNLWRHLRACRLKGLKFRRQFPIGPYIVDFICLEHKIVIECDGEIHALQKEYDQNRDQWLNLAGYRVLRFLNHHVLQEYDTVLNTIYEACKNRTD